MYHDMVTLQTMDTIFYEAQRQGRISFYVTTIGEEAVNIASAAALAMDDVIFPQVTSKYTKKKIFLYFYLHLVSMRVAMYTEIHRRISPKMHPISSGMYPLNLPQFC